MLCHRSHPESKLEEFLLRVRRSIGGVPGEPLPPHGGHLPLHLDMLVLEGVDLGNQPSGVLLNCPSLGPERDQFGQLEPHFIQPLLGTPLDLRQGLVRPIELTLEKADVRQGRLEAFSLSPAAHPRGID